MHTAFLDRGMDRLSDDFAGARMGVVALDHNRTARRQRRRGVAACSRKGQREIRRAKHRHRADRALHHPNVGAWQRLTVRQRHIVTAIQIRALEDMRCKQAQLTSGAATFALKAAFG